MMMNWRFLVELLIVAAIFAAAGWLAGRSRQGQVPPTSGESGTDGGELSPGYRAFLQSLDAAQRRALLEATEDSLAEAIREVFRNHPVEPPRHLFELIDLNGDGRIDPAEFEIVANQLRLVQPIATPRGDMEMLLYLDSLEKIDELLEAPSTP